MKIILYNNIKDLMIYNMRVNEITDNEKRLCENLNKYMKLKQKKGVDLANQLDITTASASRMMTGVSVPNVEQVLKICEFLDITIYELLGIENPYNLSNEEFEIIKDLRENPESFKYAKQLLNIK